MLEVKIFTLYPDLFPGPLDIGIFKKAKEKKIWNLKVINAETKLTRSFKEGVIQPNGKKLKEATMDVNHVAETIINILKLPLDTNILNLTIMANKMPYIGRG